ncbi:Pr6Pr family membrane protein [Reinekea sp. G2M2-21]|uniref:Pr6Pr family membrane protein n=1 Tax=Reinekea sp. G2M2-21 TaxID=2788942 RepID=UPI0018A94292|nr:Pr6Pr family membrane protein [Reinekea sp. G2M2-21]
MTKKHTIFYTLLLASSFGGFVTSYFPGVIGHDLGFWISDLIATLSYFTIISNLAVSALAVSQLFYAQTKIGLWFSRMSVQTAIAVYISITGLVYHWLLADTWNPQGIDLFSDELLHTVTPILYALFWWFCVRGKHYNLQRTLAVLVVPALFLVYWLIRGPIVGTYPYFFIDVSQYGYTAVFINSLGLCFAFWVVGVFYWALSRFTTPLYV